MWDERDKELDLRGKMAQIIAAKTSGLDPKLIVPEPPDFELADEFANIINLRNDEK